MPVEKGIHALAAYVAALGVCLYSESVKLMRLLGTVDYNAYLALCYVH